MEIFKCRICGAMGENSYHTILETETPLAADVTDEPSKNMKRYSLTVVRCNQCGHVQLKETLDRSFYGDYLYTPSFASGFADYIDEFVLKISKEIDKPERKVIEIGSSNGYLLSKMQEAGWRVLGVEPSEILAEKANEGNVPTYCGFFSKNTVKEIKGIIGKPDVLIFRHVMEHLDNLNEIVEAIKTVLEDGLLLIEVPYLKRIVKESQFYAFFHEHLSYFSVTSVRNLFEPYGLYVHRVYENNLEGGSILVEVDRSKAVTQGDNIDDYLIDEQESLSTKIIYEFSDKINRSIEDMKTVVTKAKQNRKTVAAWGAGQRGCTLISVCGFQSEDIDYVIDVNRNYWNKYVPGTDIKIVSDNYYLNHYVDYMLIFATGYADSIIAENKRYIDNGGKFIKII